MKRSIPLAITYDFDGTLAPGNMQERKFIPDIGLENPGEFWREVKALSKEHEADNNLVYMNMMLEKAQAKGIPVRRENFAAYGAGLHFFKGILAEGGEAGWFDRINAYASEKGIAVEHYVISSGIREMVEGTPIADKFKAIFASSFWYDHHGVPKWPALVVNYTTKTQYLFRINKGVPNVYDHDTLNEFMPEGDRRIPFDHIVFIGDGDTDVPCFRLVKEKNGHSIAVHEPRKPEGKARAQRLIDDGRVNFAAPADYRDGQELDGIVRAIIDKITADMHLAALRKPG